MRLFYFEDDYQLCLQLSLKKIICFNLLLYLHAHLHT